MTCKDCYHYEACKEKFAGLKKICVDEPVKHLELNPVRGKRMREILFRGKRTDNGKWVTGLLARYNPKYEIANMVTDFDVLVPVYTETVGQFTGLTDKNGVRIFEGDIVKYKNSSPCKIDYIDSQFVMMWKNFYRNFEQVYDDEIEVIGNIYDYPELLEV